MKVTYLTTDRPNHEFNLWLSQVREMGWSCEIVVEGNRIDKIHVKMPAEKDNSNGDWRDVEYGRIILSKVVSYKQKVFLPRIVDGKFIYNYSEKKV